MCAAIPVEQPHTAQGRFTTTHWSIVLRAGHSDSPEATEALEQLCQKYWFPLYAFIRRQGHDSHRAKDLTQDFLSRMLAGNQFQDLDASKGKFRTFLLSCLNHFLCNEYDRACAAKRGGGRPQISLDELTAEERYRLEPASKASADQIFEKNWAITILEHALDRLQREFELAGKREQFEWFRSFLEGEVKPGDYERAAAELKSTPGAVATAVHRLRRRYRELVRGEIAQTVATEDEIELEMSHLVEALSR